VRLMNNVPFSAENGITEPNFRYRYRYTGARLMNNVPFFAENGITEPNFRYTGARLCDYLSLHLTMIIEGATLRQILMQK
jgi:hypothetical protein